MKYSYLVYGDKLIKSQREIETILKSEKFYWLIDSEIENAELEIKNNTLIWHNGVFYFGNWFYGIFKNGVFNGIWENGIFENGVFNGKWKSGIKH